jgi:hypothetical protein
MIEGEDDASSGPNRKDRHFLQMGLYLPFPSIKKKIRRQFLIDERNYQVIPYFSPVRLIPQSLQMCKRGTDPS